MDIRITASQLLDEWHRCDSVHVPSSMIDILLDKDKCVKLVNRVESLHAWGDSDKELEDACTALYPALQKLKERIVFEVLKHGTI